MNMMNLFLNRLQQKKLNTTNRKNFYKQRKCLQKYNIQGKLFKKKRFVYKNLLVEARSTNF